MTEEREEPELLGPFYTLPTELFITIFLYLPPKDFMKCRRVCTKWRFIIDSYASNDSYWYKICKREFESYHWIAKQKAKPDLSWFYLYRTLSSWPQISEAQEISDEFASASRLLDEVRSIEIQGKGIVSVHKKGGVEYYDGDSLALCTRGMIAGDYARYTENDTLIVIQSYHLQLYIIRKQRINNFLESTTTFDNVKMFLLTDTELYFAKLNDEIHVCDINAEPITSKFIKRAYDTDGVMSLGFSDGCLHVLTYQRNIYTIVGKKDMVLKQNLTSERNILNVLYKYNFLDQLDWRVYFQWMYVLNHSVPNGPMRDIIVIRPYGDVYFVGSNFGVLCIFYKPYTNGELDVFTTKPARQINFMDRTDIPVLATCPILQIDVIETRCGHTVYVAMPKKVAVLKFVHSFLQPIKWSVESKVETEIHPFYLGDEFAELCAKAKEYQAQVDAGKIKPVLPNPCSSPMSYVEEPGSSFTTRFNNEICGRPEFNIHARSSNIVTAARESENSNAGNEAEVPETESQMDPCGTQ